TDQTHVTRQQQARTRATALRAGCRLGYSLLERMTTDRKERTMTSITRRSMLRGVTAVAAGAFAGRAVLAPTNVFAQARPGASAEGVKALVYDVFGTCTDWRYGVARDAECIFKAYGFNFVWREFANGWLGL